MKKDAPSPVGTSKQNKKADTVVSPPPATPKKKPKKWLVAGISAIVVLIIGVGAASAAYLMQQNSPNRILADSLLNAMAMPNQKNDTKVTVKVKGVDVEIAIQAVARDTVQSGTAKVSVALPGQSAFDFTAHIYQKDHKTVYVKLDNPEKLATLLPGETLQNQLITTVTRVISDKWLRLDTTAGETRNECAHHITQKLRQHNTNEAKAVRKALHEHQFITHDESVKLDDRGSSRGYQVRFDMEAAKQFIGALEKDESAKEIADCAKKVKTDFESVIKQYKAAQLKEVKKDKAEVTDVTAQLWVDPATRRITDAKLQMVLKGKNEKGQDEKVGVMVETKVEYGDFDTAAEPAKDATVSIEELMQAVVEGALGQNDTLEGGDTEL